MKIAFYTGDHKKDGLFARIGWAFTKWAQKGEYDHITHCEAIHQEWDDGSVLIASSSLRDDGVRGKQVWLNKNNWLVADVPQWDAAKSIALLSNTEGAGYDFRGALATQLPGSPQNGRWFCSQWVAQPYLKASATFGPHNLAAIAFSIGRDCTQEFFNGRVFK